VSFTVGYEELTKTVPKKKAGWRHLCELGLETEKAR
jgi:hypothetical protein